MFKVLVFSYYYPPMGLSGVQRTLKFTKYMKCFDWDPTVITAGNTAYYAHDTQLLKEITEAEIRVIRTEAFDPNSLLQKYGTVEMPRESFRKKLSQLSKTFFIPDNKLSWSQRAKKVAAELLRKEKFDIIYVTIPPFSTFTIAAELKKEFDIPLFVDYRDLWYGNQFAYYPTPYHSYKHKSLEDNALRAADKIIVVNRRIKEQLLTNYKFLNFDDIIILPHGFDPEDFKKVQPIPKSNDKMILTYSGIFYENITPKYLLKAMKEISEERPDVAANIELHFIGHFRKENHKIISELGLQQFIRIFGYLNHLEALRKVISSDILWVMLSDTPNMDKVSSGKLFEYFGTRKPIIASVPDGATKTAAENYGASFITKPEDVASLKETIYKVHELYKGNNLPKPNDEFVLEHDRKWLTEKLTKEFQFFLKEEV